jgi:peptide/nickel transport system substrate-binding protein
MAISAQNLKAFCDKRLFRGLIFGLALSLMSLASAQVLRVSGAGDLSGLDPHSRNEAFSNRFLRQINEPLLARDANLKLIPGLALSWSNPSQTLWKVKLRPAVKFANGEPFTAHDVVFSMMRAQHEYSAIRHYAQGVGKATVIDAHNVEFKTDQPNPVFLEQLALIPIMSETWTKAKGCLVPANFKQKQETPCTTSSNGTGPMKIAAWKVGLETRYERNLSWWGDWKSSTSNVQSVTYRPAASSAARLAGLLGGDVDLIFDASPTEVVQIGKQSHVQVLKAVENRTVYFGFNQKSVSIEPNPLKSALVRRALAQAIDHEGLQKKIYRGYSDPSFSMVMRNANGHLGEHEIHPKYDEQAAKLLLREAGYKDGFAMRLGCPSDRYPSDLALCTAVAAMWSKLGIKVSLVSQPKTIYFGNLDALEKHFDVFLMSWGGSTTDAAFTLGPLVQTPSKASAGSDNYGGISNPVIDQLLNSAQSEMRPIERQALLAKALTEQNQQIHNLAVNRQMLIWVARNNIGVPMRSDGMLDFPKLRVDR